MLLFAIGACDGVGGNVCISAFGIFTLVAMMPVITLQLFGLVYAIKSKAAASRAELLVEKDTIIELDSAPTDK